MRALLRAFAFKTTDATNGKLGEWLIKKAQEHKKKYIDDEELFE